MYLSIFDNLLMKFLDKYLISLVITLVGFIITFLIWDKNQNRSLKKIMLVFLIMFCMLLLVGISGIGYIIFSVIKSN